MSALNGADWIILAILALSVLIGLWRGLVREVVSLLIWLVAIAAAIMFGAQVAELYAAWVDVPSARIALGYATVFLVVLLLLSLIGWLVNRMVQGTGLTGTDRLLGLGFGLLRGGVIVAALILVLGYTPFPRDPWWQQSQLIPRFEPAAVWLREQMPETLAALQALTPPKALESGLPRSIRSPDEPANGSDSKVD